METPPPHAPGTPAPAAGFDLLHRNLMIKASAGSGKTYQLGNRVIGLIASGADPREIVALTFTRKAAGEFADAILTQLARAAADPAESERLRGELNLPEADFRAVLAKVVRTLPQLTLGTIDSFFARIVRGFQYEFGLTGGSFDLLEGPRQTAAENALLEKLLGDTNSIATGNPFYHAFRRTRVGREDLHVARGFREFIKSWHGLYRDLAGLQWGPERLANTSHEEWESSKHRLLDSAADAIGMISFTNARQENALIEVLDALRAHTIGSGSLSDMGSLGKQLVSPDCILAKGAQVLSHYKEFTLPAAVAEPIREAVRFAAACELSAALERTRAVREVMAEYDKLCEARLRRRGKLAFDDVKRLMGSWATSEQARLSREQIDFRLGMSHHHWLLDEFQDTSNADWLGLKPLIEEAGADQETSSVFVVGDKKQAIYGWRGGDVRLFDEVRKVLMEVQEVPLDESWRSCPEVLALVNQVCGDQTTLAKLFPGAAGRWDWRDHQSAGKLTTAEQRGHARVEVIQKDDTSERLISVLRQAGVGSRKLSCGVLVRTNDVVRKVAEALREAGFEVVEEGRREPSKDHPLGVFIWQLLRWLADPADAFARETVRMSPLAAVLAGRYGGEPAAWWLALTEKAANLGVAGMIDDLTAACWDGWSDFARRRAGDLTAALEMLDAGGTVTLREAADALERLEMAQSPGVAAVQVMTIHKAKGLGFDLVVLPEIPAEAVPNATRFDIAQGDGWITETPAKWVRALIPELSQAESAWGADQQYEAMCMLYVALTRAKRGLIAFLKPSKEKKNGTREDNLANWLATAIRDRSPDPVTTPGTERIPMTDTLWQCGNPEWFLNVPMQAPVPAVSVPPALGAATPRRARLRPSGTGHGAAAPGPRNSGGLAFGRALHAAFEQVAWIDESPPALPADEAGRRVAELLAMPSLRSAFERRGRPIALFREQALDAVINDQWLSGVIDRLHLHRAADGTVTHLEVIDFKTDAVDDPRVLLERHAGQLRTYRAGLALAFPGAEISCRLLSTKLAAWIDVD